jgi:hypothetical protein
MTRPPFKYRPGVPLPHWANQRVERQPPTAEDPAQAFHLTHRFTLYKLLMGRAPKRKHVSDDQLRGAARSFRSRHTEQEYQAVATQAYLAGYRTMAEILKRKRESQNPPEGNPPCPPSAT